MAGAAHRSPWRGEPGGDQALRSNLTPKIHLFPTRILLKHNHNPFHNSETTHSPRNYWKNEAQVQKPEGGRPCPCPNAEEGSTVMKPSMEASWKHLRAAAKAPEAQVVRTKYKSKLPPPSMSCKGTFGAAEGVHAAFGCWRIHLPHHRSYQCPSFTEHLRFWSSAVTGFDIRATRSRSSWGGIL
jgi:hypothetical protein